MGKNNKNVKYFTFPFWMIHLGESIKNRNWGDNSCRNPKKIY